MDDLIGRLVANAGADRAPAEKTFGIIQQLPLEDGSVETARALTELVTDADRRMPTPDSSLRRPSMGRTHAITEEKLSFAREAAGEHAVGEVVGAIPGQFV